MDLLQRNNVNVLDWPARFITYQAHVGYARATRFHERHDVNSLADLERALHQEWRRIPVYNK